jgi:DNA-binding NarL/FixJ family response regulator
MNRIHVLIAEDKKYYREELRRTLEGSPNIRVVGEAADGGQAIELVKTLVPDVIIMDLRMEPVGGLEAIRKIMMIRPSAKILVLTIDDREHLMFECLRAGAKGYLLKDASADEIVRAVEAVSDLQTILSPALAEHLIAYFDKIAPVRDAELFPELSQRELDVLRTMAQGYKNREIAERLQLTPKTVANYVYNIIDKLQVSDRTEAILRARKSGLVDSRAE